MSDWWEPDREFNLPGAITDLDKTSRKRKPKASNPIGFLTFSNEERTMGRRTGTTQSWVGSSKHKGRKRTYNKRGPTITDQAARKAKKDKKKAKQKAIRKVKAEGLWPKGVGKELYWGPDVGKEKLPK